MRPDVILHFPDQKDAIIDSKVSLTAYERFVNATEDTERDITLKQHLESMRKHVDELAAKNYNKYLPKQHSSIDFVIMFVPFEGAFQAAMQNDPTLWTEALKKNVCIAGELNLTVILRMIKMAWTQFDQTQNQEEVYKNAEILIKRVGLFCKRYADLGKSIMPIWERALKPLKNAIRNAMTYSTVARTCWHRHARLLPWALRTTNAFRVQTTNNWKN